MKIHPRVIPAQIATAEMSQAVWKIANERDMTYGEVVMALGEIGQSFAKYMIREERHPKHDHEGGLVCDRKGCRGQG